MNSADRPGKTREEGAVYSKDYWDLVFEQLSRRKLFKLGTAVLALMYAAAIYAPLIANDRPYVLDGIDLAGFKSASRTLYNVANELGGRIGQTDEDYARDLEAAGTAGLERVPQDLAGAIVQVRAAAEQRLELIRRHLPEDSVQPALGELERLLDAAIAARSSGDPALAQEKAGAANDLARELRTALTPWEPADPGVEGL